MNQLLKDAKSKVHTAPKKPVRMKRVDPEHLDAQQKLKEFVAAVKKTLHTLKMEKKLRERKHKRVMKKCNILSNSELVEIMIMKRNVAKAREKAQRAKTLEILEDDHDPTGALVVQPDGADAVPSTPGTKHSDDDGGAAIAGTATDTEQEQAKAQEHEAE